MKTAKFLMMFVAAAAMMFAACDKDDDDNNTPTEAAENTAIIDGRVYHLHSRYSIEQSGRGYVDAESQEQNAEGEALVTVRGDVDASGANRTFDLTQAYADASYAFGISTADESIMAGQDMHGASPYGEFQSGTLTITLTDDLMDYKVIGTLRSGHNVSFHVTVPASEWVQLEW